MKAKWHGQPYYDYSNKQWLITLETAEQPGVFDKTKDKLLNVEIKEHREKRSLSANAYFHVLVDKIAGVNGVSHAEIHNQMIADYGFVDEDIKNLILDDNVPYLQLTNIHLRPTSATKVMDNGKLYRVFIVMRGSHTYDTKEMARLIDGVVSEAKSLGIETLPPDELERMKQAWNQS